jgi:Oligoendopeptidase F
MEKDTTTKAWIIDTEYPSMTSPEFVAHKNLVEEGILALQKFGDGLDKMDLQSEETLAAFEKTILYYFKNVEYAWNMTVYLSCMSSVDTTRDDVRAEESKINDLFSRLSQSYTATEVFLKSADDSFITKLLSRPAMKPVSFMIGYQRLQKPYALSKAEETLLEAFGVTGHNAWMELYHNLVGSMKVNASLNGEDKQMGLSEAYAVMYGTSEAERKPTWHGIQKAWKDNQESAAAIVNNLAGWRIELAKKRSHTKPMTYLTQALFDNRISESTLNALIGALRKNNPEILKAGRLMAKMAGKTQLDPWDLTAAYPGGGKGQTRPYAEGMKLVQSAFQEINPELSDFAKMMDEKSWIDSQLLETKSTGGYCTGFAISREPRIFMSYKGSMNHISTLAHELGHAYHSWVMRDLATIESSYPSTLAETASVYAEQVLLDYVSANSTDKNAANEAAWSELETVFAYLVDIPSRFEFEKKFHDKRKEQTLSAKELCALMGEVRADWYKDSVSTHDTYFWASKLHFSIAGSGFYNFAYSFGYLFAMSLYARRKEKGPEFNKVYVEILRDTGRMTAEDLIKKHLGEDITQEAFWQKSIDMVLQKLAVHEKNI